MAKQFALLSALFLCTLTIAQVGYGQERPPDRTQEKSKTGTTTRDPRQPQKAASQKIDDEQSPVDSGASPDVALGSVLLQLSQQISVLTQEVKKMRQESERNSTMLELLLYEERLLRLEEKINEVTNYKAQLDAREQDILRRQKNIPQELALRGAAYALRRDEAEAAIKQELQRALDDTKAQQTTYQTKITEMQAEADRLRFRTEMLRQKAQRLETKLDETTKPTDKK